MPRAVPRWLSHKPNGMAGKPILLVSGHSFDKGGNPFYTILFKVE